MGDFSGGFGPSGVDDGYHASERDRSGERTVPQLRRPSRSRWPLFTVGLVILGVLGTIAALASG